MVNKDFEFYLKADLSRYKGKYVAIVEAQVVGSGDNAKELLEEVTRKYPDKRPTLVKVPKEEALILKIKWK